MVTKRDAPIVKQLLPQSLLGAFVVLACGADGDSHHDSRIAEAEFLLEDEVQDLRLPHWQTSQRRRELFGSRCKVFLDRWRLRAVSTQRGKPVAESFRNPPETPLSALLLEGGKANDGQPPSLQRGLAGESRSVRRYLYVAFLQDIGARVDVSTAARHRPAESIFVQHSYLVDQRGGGTHAFLLLVSVIRFCMTALLNDVQCTTVELAKTTSIP
jgi:hypothetical protein